VPSAHSDRSRVKFETCATSKTSDAMPAVSEPDRRIRTSDTCLASNRFSAKHLPADFGKEDDILAKAAISSLENMISSGYPMPHASRTADNYLMHIRCDLGFSSEKISDSECYACFIEE
jgi:hypothetical protein